MVSHAFPSSSAAQVAALAMTALVLSACNKTPSRPPVPVLAPAQSPTVPTTAGAADTSVPEAGAVLAPATAVKADPAAGRPNSTMTRTQESGAMPLPGQNNDHSAPLTPVNPASKP